MKKLVLAFLVILLTACSPSSSMPVVTPTQTQVPPSATPTLTATPTHTPTPTSTATPSPTPTLVPISTEEQGLILQAYKIMLFIQLDANMLDQVATKVNAGELTGFNSLGGLIALAAVINAVDEAIPQTTTPEIFSPYWEQALSIHAATKDLTAKWFNKEIDSSVVLDDVAPYLEQIEKIMDDLDKELASSYGFNLQDMKKYREDAIQSFNGIFGTPTPAP